MEITMKQALLILMFTFNISSAATQLTVEDGHRFFRKPTDI